MLHHHRQQSQQHPTLDSQHSAFTYVTQPNCSASPTATRATTLTTTRDTRGIFSSSPSLSISLSLSLSLILIFNLNIICNIQFPKYNTIPLGFFVANITYKPRERPQKYGTASPRTQLAQLYGSKPQDNRKPPRIKQITENTITPSNHAMPGCTRPMM